LSSPTIRSKTQIWGVETHGARLVNATVIGSSAPTITFDGPDIAVVPARIFGTLTVSDGNKVLQIATPAAPIIRAVLS
jgi:hypothetical protein